MKNIMTLIAIAIFLSLPTISSAEIPNRAENLLPEITSSNDIKTTLAAPAETLKTTKSVQNTPQEPVSQCATLVKECYSKNTGNDRTNCLFSSAKHPFCEGTDLGKLTYKRWIMSPTKNTGIDNSGLSFLGPKAVDQECLNTFDTDLISKINTMNKTDGDINQVLKKLSDELTSCTKSNK